MTKEARTLVFIAALSGVLLVFTTSCRKDQPDNKMPVETSKVIDIEGNVYKTVKIGTQWWMAENLKVTKYANGDLLPNITDDTQWENLTKGAYCWYNNDIANKDIYGALYNWHTVTDSRKIAPTGWHVPTEAEWATMVNCLGGGEYIGNKIKEPGTTHWEYAYSGVTNESGFTALPGGLRMYNNGSYYYLHTQGFWWTTDKNENNGWALYLTLTDSRSWMETADGDPNFGYSIRCVKDQEK